MNKEVVLSEFGCDFDTDLKSVFEMVFGKFTGSICGFERCFFMWMS